nr:glycosyltransferase family 2 protein [Bacteroidota bacterium]
MKSISIIIPVYNEVGNVAKLHQEVVDVCRKIGASFELIFVDDGSNDGTAKIIKTLKPAKIIRLRKNFGQTAALDVGFRHVRNEYVITMDGDGQNDPADIPGLIKHLEENDLDVVSGWRKNRKDTYGKRMASRVANILRGILIKDGIQDSGCTMKIYTRESISELSLFGEMHRFIPALLIMRGFKIGEIPVNHRYRKYGKTKYDIRRTIKGVLDMMSVWFWKKFALRPLHLLGGAGILFLLAGFVSGIFTVNEYLKGQSMSDSAMPILTAFLLFTGLQLFISGLMSDMISKIYYKRYQTQSYFIHEITENNDDAGPGDHELHMK